MEHKHRVGFSAVRSTAYLLTMLATPEISDPRKRALVRAAIIVGAGFVETELRRRESRENGQRAK